MQISSNNIFFVIFPDAIGNFDGKISSYWNHANAAIMEYTEIWKMMERKKHTVPTPDDMNTYRIPYT